MEEDACWATVGSEGCRGWKKAQGRWTDQPGPAVVNFQSLDRKNTQKQNVKHVLQRGPLACVIFPTVSTKVNVTTQDYQHYEFKFFDMGSQEEVVPCDFDGESIFVIKRSKSETSDSADRRRGPSFCFINLERPKELVEVEELPYGSSVSLAKLWGNDCLAYVAGGSSVYVYDYRRKQLREQFSHKNAEVIAMDASDPERIVTLSCDAQVSVWQISNSGSRLILNFHVPEASFFLGFPYCIALCQKKIMLSADEGAILIEFD
jgi:hypothetical protein